MMSDVLLERARAARDAAAIRQARTRRRRARFTTRPLVSVLMIGVAIAAYGLVVLVIYELAR